LLVCAAWPTQGATYVIKTDDTPLSAGQLNALGAGQGTNTPGWSFFSPSRTGSLNGTPFRFAGYSDSTAAFVVGGNLNLNPNDRILGMGPNFLKLDVAGDANIPAGASISVAGHYLVPGAGGGAGGGGGVYPEEIPPANRLEEAGKFPPPTRGGFGQRRQWHR
jgi:hypothetical protein